MDDFFNSSSKWNENSFSDENNQIKKENNSPLDNMKYEENNSFFFDHCNNFFQYNLKTEQTTYVQIK